MKTVRPIQRIDRILANLGYCGRREVPAYLARHMVTVNGTRIRESSIKVDPHHLYIDSVALDYPDGLLLLMNKPAGYVCSHDTSEGRLVYDLLPKQWMHRHPVPSTVGRLDKDTTGIILITDIPTINHAWSAPHRLIDKVYQVTVDKPLSSEIPFKFGAGMLLAGERKACLPVTMRIDGMYCAEVILREGKYHQIKRMFQQCGYTVTKLHRSRFGPYTDEEIAVGTFRHIALLKV